MIVVTDTSVLLNLAWLGQEDLLWRLFSTVLAPPVVRVEFERLASIDARFSGLRFPESVRVVAPTVIPRVLIENKALDPGETAALALAIERGIRNVLIDESAGRIAALALGLQPSGLLGVLIESKKRGLIPRVLPLLDSLRDGARFYIADDLRCRIAALAEESPDS